jgi:Bacterial PH domain
VCKPHDLSRYAGVLCLLIPDWATKPLVNLAGQPPFFCVSRAGLWSPTLVDMAPDDRAGLTATDVHRWLRGLQPFHAARFAVMVAVVGATSVSIYAHPQCGPPNPFCGPSPQSTWGLALLLASLVLLLGAPGLGCLSAFALGVLLAGYDPAISARGWWAAEAALSAAALVLLLLIRVHQHRVAATIERRITLPGGGTPTEATWDGLRAQFDGLRAQFIGVAAAVGIVLMIIYQYQASASDEHLRHAVQTDAVVQHVDDLRDSTTVKYWAHLYLPDTDQVVTVDLASEDDYQIDEKVPVMVDSTGREPWMRLVARPDDQTSWLSFAILAWLLATAVMLRPARVWWAQRRPADGDLRGILVSIRWPGPDDNAEISAADGSGLRLCVLRSPVPARLVVEPDKVWRPPELGVVTGQLWYGGIVRLYALDGEVLAHAIMGLPQLTLLHSWHAPPTPSTVEDDDEFDGNAEPAYSRAPMVIDGDGPQGAAELTPFAAYDGSHRLIRWTLWFYAVFYAVLAVGAVGFVVAGGSRSDSNWWALVILPGIVLLCLVPFLPHFARAHVAVSGDGVTVVNSWSTYRIPWSAIDKVDLRLACGLWQRWCSNAPEDDFQLRFTTRYGIFRAEVPVGPDAPTGGMAALVNRIVDYRDRTRVTDADPATAVKVTGAAARRRRERSPVSDSLPPADIAGRVQDDATASQPPTGGRHRFGRR